MKRHDWINLGVGSAMVVVFLFALWMRTHGAEVHHVIVELLRDLWPAQQPVVVLSVVSVGVVALATDDDDSDL